MIVPELTSGVTLTVSIALQLPTVYDINAVPPVTPVTIAVGPVPPVVAIPALELLHVPVTGFECKVVVAPGQILLLPVIAAGETRTVIDLVAGSPHIVVYDMVQVPLATPVTAPLAASTVALLALLLLQLPPGTASLSITVCPVHTDELPEIGTGTVVTDTVVIAAHDPL
jgi:hypothetical protein